MAGRVDLRVPPRLIETARAAQYANREALGARELERKIKGRAQRQVAAVKRADPIRNGLEGGQLEFSRPEIYPIRTGRRKPNEIDAAVGLVRANLSYNNHLEDPFPEATGGQSFSNESGTRSISLCIGSGNGLSWSPAIDAENWTLTIRYTGTYVYTPATPTSGAAVGLQDISRVYTNSGFTTHLAQLPLNNNAMLIVAMKRSYSLTETVADVFNPVFQRSGSQELTFRYFLVTETSVQETAPADVRFMRERIANLSMNPFGITLLSGFIGLLDFSSFYRDAGRLGLGFIEYANDQSGSLRGLTSFLSKIIGTTSSCYELLNNVGFVQGQNLDQYCLGRFREVTGRQWPDLINVRSSGGWLAQYDPVGSASGSFGGFQETSMFPSILPRPSVCGSYRSEDVFSSQAPPFPLSVDDELDLGIAANLAAPLPFIAPQFDYGINNPNSSNPLYVSQAKGTREVVFLTYDMHGGNYCRDQLAALGITLP